MDLIKLAKMSASKLLQKCGLTFKLYLDWQVRLKYEPDLESKRKHNNVIKLEYGFRRKYFFPTKRD